MSTSRYLTDWQFRESLPDTVDLRLRCTVPGWAPPIFHRWPCSTRARGERTSDGWLLDVPTDVMLAAYDGEAALDQPWDDSTRVGFCQVCVIEPRKKAVAS